MIKFYSFIKKDYYKTQKKWRSFLEKNQFPLFTILIVVSTSLIFWITILQSQNDIYYKRMLASSQSYNRSGILYSANSSITTLDYLDTIRLGCYDCNDNCSSNCLEKIVNLTELDKKTKAAYKKVIESDENYQATLEELRPIEDHNSLMMNIIFKIYLFVVSTIILFSIILLDFKKSKKQNKNLNKRENN